MALLLQLLFFSLYSGAPRLLPLSWLAYGSMVAAYCAARLQAGVSVVGCSVSFEPGGHGIRPWSLYFKHAPWQRSQCCNNAATATCTHPTGCPGRERWGHYRQNLREQLHRLRPLCGSGKQQPGHLMPHPSEVSIYTAYRVNVTARGSGVNTAMTRGQRQPPDNGFNMHSCALSLPRRPRNNQYYHDNMFDREGRSFRCGKHTAWSASMS